MSEQEKTHPFDDWKSTGSRTWKKITEKNYLRTSSH